MKARLYLPVLLWALALLAGCGTPGAPQPPALELPRIAENLAGSRKASRVTLAWTPPTHTTEGQLLRRNKLGPTVICRAVNDFPMATCVDAVGQVPPTATPTPTPSPRQPARMEFASELPLSLQEQNPTGFAAYAVEVRNWRGRSAGLSNQINIPLAPTLPPPADFRAEVTADGILLSWTGLPHPHPAPELGHFYRIYRRAQGAESAAVAGEVTLHLEPQGTFVDRGFEWEKTYSYWITVVTVVSKEGNKIAEVEGEDSPAVTVFTHDIFPPAVPQNLESVASGVGQKPFIDLTWTPDTDTDLAGYNVYRQQPESAAWTKMNLQLLTTPAYRDTDVVPGKTYTYAVTAVDVRGNESAKSQATSEPVP